MKWKDLSREVTLAGIELKDLSYDHANQYILKKVRKYDLEGDHTLGITTLSALSLTTSRETSLVIEVAPLPKSTPSSWPTLGFGTTTHAERHAERHA